MLDQADGDALAVQRHEMAGDLFRQARIDPRHGLVEQDEPRLGHEGAADLHELLLSAREGDDRIVHHRIELQAADDRPGLFGQRLLAQAGFARADQGGHQGFSRLLAAIEHQVLEHAELGETPRQLEGAHQPPAHQRFRRQGRDILAGEGDRAAIGPVEAGDHVEERRLARAIRADQAGEAALGDGDVDAIEDADAVEAAGEAGDGEEIGHALPPREGACRAGSEGKWPRT